MIENVQDKHPGSAGRRVDLMLVEDSETDIRLTRIALERTLNLRSLTVATDGDMVMRMLRREAGYERCPRPDLILLDLNLPRKNGLEVLKAIRADAGLKSIPVIVVTTSDSDIDVAQSYEHQANCFITKPMELDSFFEIAESIRDFWTDKARLPPKSMSSA